jgi:head-tail adaptor
MQAGVLRHRVSLANAPTTSGDADGFFEPCDPADVWCAIEPVAPGTSDGTRVQGHYVTMRYHPQITVETRLLFGTRELFVKGLQNIGERNRELRLYCEEVL